MQSDPFLSSIVKNPLDFVLDMICTDLKCYAESYSGRDDGRFVFEKCGNVGLFTDPKVKNFSLSAGSEAYTRDVGLVGAASAEHTHRVYNLKEIAEDKYFFNAGGPRLAESVAIFHTAITIPLRKLPWTPDQESVNCSAFNIRSCLRYRPTEIIGVIVLYFIKPPKLFTELNEYLQSVVHCAAPIVDLYEERTIYLRREYRGGNKYRRFRRALLATIRAKKLPPTEPNTVVAGSPSSVGSDAQRAPEHTRQTASSDAETATASISEPPPPHTPEEAESEGTMHSKGYQPLSVDGSAQQDQAHSPPPPPSKAPSTQLELLCQAQLDLTHAYLRKWLGDKVALPARIDVRLSFVAWVGCFVTIGCWQVMTDGINQIFYFRGKDQFFSLPGSFGALCTIIFALPAVPLAQPRIVLLAHTWAMTVTTILIYICKPYHYVWLQKALAVAFTVSGMAKMGILNPPAGAVSLAMMTYYNSPAFSEAGWLFLIVSTYLGCSVCIVVGVVWHNFFTGRTYPLYW